MNREWHLAHPMPPRATEAERMAWHLAHAAHCACRPIPDRLLARLREQGIDPPAPPPSDARLGTPTPRPPPKPRPA